MKMNSSEVLQALILVFQDIFEDPCLVIQRDTSAADIDEWDSARMVELIMAAEARFGVKLTTRETDALRSVGDFVDVIVRKLALQSA
jgi:acyl carrier protein